MAKKGGMDLDSILDQALDDFEEIETAENAKKVLSRGSKQSGRKSEILRSAGEKEIDPNKVLAKLLSRLAFASMNTMAINQAVFTKGGQDD